MSWNGPSRVKKPHRARSTPRSREGMSCCGSSSGRRGRVSFLMAVPGPSPGTAMTRPLSPRLHLWIGKPQLLALLISDDLLEGFAEIEIEIVPFGPSEMRHAERVRHF